MTDTEKYLAACCAAALSGKQCADFPVWVDAEALFKLAVFHNVAGTVYYALKDAEGLPASLSELLEAEHNSIADANRISNDEENRIFAALDKADIAYLPLIGGAMPLFYPQSDMRARLDAVMIDGYARKDARRVMEGCGCRLNLSRGGRDFYACDNKCILELCFRPEDESEFHRGLMERALPVGTGGTRLSMSRSDFYVYMISHFAQKLRTFTARLSLFADVNVFLLRCGDKLNREYIDDRLREMGLFDFEAAVRRAVTVLFYDSSPSEQTTELINCIFESDDTLSRERRKSRRKLLSALGLANSKSGKARMSGNDVAASLLTVALLIFAIALIGLAFFQKQEEPFTDFDGDSAQAEHSDVLSGDLSAQGAQSEDEVSGEESYAIPVQVFDIIPYKNGVYKGYLANGLPNGQGILNLPNGELYKGSFADGEFNGKGKYWYADGKTYDGMWFEGEIFGQGKLSFPDGSFISANFEEGKPRGECTFQNADGDLYVGELKNGKRTGKGRFVWASGDVYEGNYVDGEREGQGKYTNVTGDSYTGEWIAGVPNGEGVMVRSGVKYEGVFVQGELEGEGVSTVSNGDRYTGYFVGGKFSDDFAVYTFANGGKYEGAFEDNLFNGKGKYTYPDGDRVEGTFKDGVLQGTALYYDKSTGISRYVSYKNGKPA